MGLVGLRTGPSKSDSSKRSQLQRYAVLETGRLVSCPWHGQVVPPTLIKRVAPPLGTQPTSPMQTWLAACPASVQPESARARHAQLLQCAPLRPDVHPPSSTTGHQCYFTLCQNRYMWRGVLVHTNSELWYSSSHLRSTTCTQCRTISTRKTHSNLDSTKKRCMGRGRRHGERAKQGL